MSNKLFIIALVFILIIAFGCAGTAGKKFNRLREDKIQLGITTYKDILRIMGEPYKEEVFAKNDYEFKQAIYSFSSTGGKSTSKRVTAARVQSFYFHEDILVGHLFISNWEDDHTDFDETKIKLVKKEENTKADVIKLFGNPSGNYIYPFADNKGKEIIVYWYTEHRHYAYAAKNYRKRLYVEYDREGIVTDINYYEYGGKQKSP